MSVYALTTSVHMAAKKKSFPEESCDLSTTGCLLSEDNTLNENQMGIEVPHASAVQFVDSNRNECKYDVSLCQSWSTYNDKSAENKKPEKLVDGMSSCELGIAVKSANLDCKRYIAATSYNASLSSSALSNYYVRESTVARETLSMDQGQEAIEFELKINFYDREYTVFRSFPRIIQLRNELREEILIRKIDYLKLFPINRSLVVPKRSLHCECGISDDLVCGNSSAESDINEIPELPNEMYDSLSESSAPLMNRLKTGLAYRSLRMMSMILKRHCPKIEIWFINVLKIVDPKTSPALERFITEEISENVFDKVKEKRMEQYIKRKRRSKEQNDRELWSISEDSVVEEKISEEPNLCKNEIQGYIVQIVEDEIYSECDAFI